MACKRELAGHFFALCYGAITSKGQVTIPAEIRKAMGLTAGERVIFTQLDDGTTVFRAKTRSIRELRGILKHARGRKRRVSIKDMNTAAM